MLLAGVADAGLYATNAEVSFNGASELFQFAEYHKFPFYFVHMIKLIA